jgi:hypothetical protein
MEVIQFPPARGLLDFDGMDIKIDVDEQRENWGATFTDVQIALRFCNLDYVEAEEMARNSLDEDGGWFIDETGSRWTESVEHLESIVATMKAALVRLEVSEDRALGRRGESNDNQTKETQSVNVRRDRASPRTPQGCASAHRRPFRIDR